MGYVRIHRQMHRPLRADARQDNDGKLRAVVAQGQGNRAEEYELLAGGRVRALQGFKKGKVLSSVFWRGESMAMQVLHEAGVALHGQDEYTAYVLRETSAYKGMGFRQLNEILPKWVVNEIVMARNTGTLRDRPYSQQGE